MAKAKEQKTDERKQPGIQVAVFGQVVLKEDRSRSVKKYEETFVIPRQYEKNALSIILRCLLPHRLEKKFDGFNHIRTHEIKGAIKQVEDTGFSTLQKKDLWDLDAEELRLYALCINLKLPEYRMEEGKLKIFRWLDAKQIIKTTAMDADLRTKIEKFLTPAPKKIKDEDFDDQSGSSDEVSDDDQSVGVGGVSTKETFSDLDD